MSTSYGQASPSSNLIRKWWVALWRTKIPSKIKLFIWKAFQECLPTNFCLWKGGVDISPKCKFCSKYETVDHVLCGCKRAAVICNIVFERVDKGIDIQNNFVDRIMLLAGSLSQEEFERECIAFWAIWNDQNGQCHDRPIIKDVNARAEWIYKY